MSSVLGFTFESPRRALRNLQYAGSRALNDAAFSARDALNKELPRRFKIRNKWTERGFRVVKSKRGPNPTAIVGNRRPYMADQVRGGTRRKTALPSTKLRGSRNRTIGQRRWPRALLANQRHFVATRRHLPMRLRRRLRWGQRFILRRMGRGGRRLRIQWKLRPRQRIRRRFPMHRIAQDAVRYNLPHLLEYWISQAARMR